MPMRKRATIVAAIAVLLIVAAAVTTLLWRQAHAAPRAAQLLPDSDAVVYINFRPLHLASLFATMPNVQRDPDYDNFVKATGFEFERDLDEAAIAVHLAKNPGPAAGAQDQTRFSEVFVGKFDQQRVDQYFRKIAQSVESYRGTSIYTIPVEDRMVRLAMLKSDTVGISNLAEGDVLHGMIDRAHSFSSLPGPPLVREHYHDVPLGSLAWAIARSSHDLPLPDGLTIPLASEVTWVGSVRYAGSVQLEAQAITPSEQDAQQVSDGLNALLALSKGLQSRMGTQGPDADVKSFFDSLAVKQDKNRAIVTANLPMGFLRKLASGVPSALGGQQQSTVPQASPPQAK
jgi:hypothetical protein